MKIKANADCERRAVIDSERRPYLAVHHVVHGEDLEHARGNIERVHRWQRAQLTVNHVGTVQRQLLHITKHERRDRKERNIRQSAPEEKRKDE